MSGLSGKRRKIYLTLLVALLALGKCGIAQSIQHSYGTFCVGQQNVFVFAGQGTVTSWSVTGPYTIISSNSTSVVVKWNSATGSASVTANYTLNGSHNVSYNGISIGAMVTPSVTISANKNNVCSGTSITFTATPVNGGTSPTYIWQVNGTTVSGVTGSTYTTSSLTNGSQVYCYMSSTIACVTTNNVQSNTVTMTITAPQAMTVTISGASNICSGSSVSFNVNVVNAGPNLGYQWKRNGVNVSSNTGGSPPPTVLAYYPFNNGDVFSCVVTSSDPCYPASTSNAITTNIVSPQTFTVGVSPSTGINVCTGQSITFTASPSQTATSYQWQQNGSNITGATGSTYTTTVSSLSQLQGIGVYVTTSGGCLVNTTATGTAAAIPFTVNTTNTPTVSIASGAGNSICSGSSTTFTATPVNGGSTPAYQWLLNGSNIQGAISATYTTNSLTNGQQISCVMTSNAPCATVQMVSSSAITITVNQVQAMTATVSGNTSICPGSPVNLSADVTNGSSSLNYQWKRNGVNISSDGGGSQLPAKILNYSQVNNGDVFSCSVTSNIACYLPSNSNGLTMSIAQPTTFQTGVSPSKVSLCQNEVLTFTANSTSPAATYQWRLNGSDIPGATGNTYQPQALSVAQLKSISVYTTAAYSFCLNNMTATGDASQIPFEVIPLVNPSVSFTASTANILIGSPVTFTAVPVNGGGLPDYQWQLNGTNVPGAIGATFTTTITSGDELQSVGLTMNSNAACAINPVLSNSQIEIFSSNWENQNYIRIHNVRIKEITQWSEVDQLSTDDKLQSTSYLDGLGRSIQKVDRAGSLSGGSWIDMVKPIVYDAAGRAVQDFIPYPTASNPGKFKDYDVIAEQSSFVRNKYNQPSTAPTYSSVVLDNSPLETVVQSMGAGQAWGGNSIGVTRSNSYNSQDENVHIWSLDYAANAIPVASPAGVYATGALYRSIGHDEKGRQAITYTDFTGNVVLRKFQEAASPNGLTDQHSAWECTYYVYDDLNRLRFIITPKAVNTLDNNGWSLSQSIVNDLCFVYCFDARGRIFSKKQPGVAAMDMVYDQRNRIVFTQDGNARANGQWLTILYDMLDRPLASGMISYSGTTSQLQVSVDNSTGTGTVSSYTLTNGAPSGSIQVSDNPLPSGSNFIPLTISYYDNYSVTTRSYTTADNSLFDASTNAAAESLPGQPTLRTEGVQTVVKKKILSDPANLTSGSWLETDNFYDEKLNQIQSQRDNALNGYDIITSRYDFPGMLFGSCIKHMAGAAGQFTVVSKVQRDRLGRLISLSKNFNNTFFKNLAEYSYDEYGRLVSKRLAPGYTGAGKSEMETLQYDFNIQGWITGINKSYALSANNYDQWDHFFGLYLGYDNSDQTFAASQFNGSLTGQIWRSQGDNSVRKYDYTFDNLDRLSSAVFSQKKRPNDNWSNAEVDFSENMDYADKNGNLNSMKRMGIVPGINTPVVVDDMRYTYGNSLHLNSNQLSRVDELSPLVGNGKLNDFQDGTNGAGTDDYQYDNNGNLVQDLNKGITDGGTGGIVYNVLDKPAKITIAGKMVIEYSYDATGIKLSKKVTNLQVTPNTVSTTYYDNDFIYQDNILQFVMHEEGRMKIITPVSTGQIVLNAGTAGANNVLSGKQGVFEYFIKDQLGNNRMVLTEEVQIEKYLATMELSSAGDPNLGTDEEKLFGKVDPATGNPTADNELHLTRLDKPAMWTRSPDDILEKVVKLTATAPTLKTGPNMILKVMAGDMINAKADYFYYTNDPSGTTNPVTDMVSSLVNALMGSSAGSGLAKMNSGLIQSSLGGSVPLQTFMNNHGDSGNPNAPKAYINVIFFDEQFRFVEPDQTTPAVGSASARVYSANDINAFLLMQQKAPKNGWAYIYLSNESNQEVYFDNLAVTQDHGRISEENHFYAFGQKIAGISSVAFNKLTTKYHYQADYSEEDDVTGWNEFDLRNYDPQTGRWIQADPYDEFPSPYIGMGNDPVNNVDPSGGFLDGSLGQIIGGTLGAAAGAYIGYLIGNNNGGNGGVGAVAGAFIGAAAGYGIGSISLGGLHIGDLFSSIFASHISEAFVASYSNITVEIVHTATTASVNMPAPNLNVTAPTIIVPPPPPHAAPSPPSPSPPSPQNQVNISFGQDANQNVVSPHTRAILQEIFRATHNTHPVITSTQRSPAAQARVMYNNIRRHGAASQHRLYGDAGDRVIDVAEEGIRQGLTREQIIANMLAEILTLGPANVSMHSADPNVVNVIDIDPNSLDNPEDFINEIRNRGFRFFRPPRDPAFHIEIPQR